MSKKRITDVGFSELLNDNDSLFINQNDSIKQIKKEDVLFGIANGGTGATTVEEARANLGVLGSMDVVDNLESTDTTLPLSANQGRLINNRLTANDGTQFRFGIDEDGKYGYIVTDSEGADTVVPFNNSEYYISILKESIIVAGGSVSDDSTFEDLAEYVSSSMVYAVDYEKGTGTYQSAWDVFSHSITVTFKNQFKSVPTVTATLDAHYNPADNYVYPSSHYTISATDITTKGFVLKLTDSEGKPTVYKWTWIAQC